MGTIDAFQRQVWSPQFKQNCFPHRSKMGVLKSFLKEMTAYEFACLYCGIDPNEQLPDDVYMEYVEPLLNRIAEYAVGEPFDDVPF